MKNIQQFVKQAEQMQKKMAVLQEKLAEERVEASAGGGVVTAVVNGRHELVKLTIKPEVVDPTDVGMLEDLIVTAINEAQRRAEEQIQSELAKVTGGMTFPGLF